MIESWKDWLAAKSRLQELRKTYALAEDQKRLADFRTSALVRRRQELSAAGKNNEDDEFARATAELEAQHAVARKAQSTRNEARYQLLTALDKAIE